MTFPSVKLGKLIPVLGVSVQQDCPANLPTSFLPSFIPSRSLLRASDSEPKPKQKLHFGKTHSEHLHPSVNEFKIRVTSPTDISPETLS